MPTYHANGVTASLITCQLQATLYDGFRLSQGKEQQQIAKRVQDFFSTGQKLSERPVGEDGSENGVLQFIGKNADLPLYMVEAGDGIEDDDDADDLAQEVLEEGPATLTNHLSVCSSSDIDSPLSSLTNTPTPTRESFLRLHPHSQLHQTLAAGKITVAEKQPSYYQAHTTRIPSFVERSKALAMDVQFTQSSFLPHDANRTSANAGLKLEVFVNGKLAEVTFIHRLEDRRHAVQLVEKYKVRFTGTRIHRQVEKPWIYSQLSGPANEGYSDHSDSGRRWAAVSASLLEEAHARGRDGFGRVPPSAELLMALAGVDLPKRLKRRQGMGVIDLVITVGQGKKHGPSASYLMQPTRLSDKKYTIREPFLAHDSMHLTNVAPTDNDIIVEASSPDIPLTKRHLTLPNLTTPSLTRSVDFAKEIGLDIDPRTVFVGSYENARGTVGKSGRTLRQRLGDLKKMNAANMQSELAKLKEEFGDNQPAKKKQKTGGEFEAFLAADVADGTQATLNPTASLKDASAIPSSVNSPNVTSPTQQHTGLPTAEALGDELSLAAKVSPSPLRTPIKITRASSLAGSPTVVPVKLPKPRGGGSAFSPTSLKFITERWPLDPLPASNATETKPLWSRPPKGANRTSLRWEPTEPTIAEVLDTFAIPDSCKGSCVGYGESPNAARQIGKARGGEFKEDEVLVAIRFVVV